jgi:exo-1,4-beta-D-glucosaminidase
MIKKIFLALLIIQAALFARVNNFEVTLSDNWQIQSSESANAGGDKISVPGYNTGNWYKTRVPSTVFAALVKNNVYKNIFYGDNLKHISAAPFAKSWWYRNEFVVPSDKGISTVKLKFDGINFYANVWVNGKLAASRDSVFGSFRQFELNITKFVKLSGKNTLAVEVFAPVPSDFTVGFVDWNPTPPDKNMGIWREVKLIMSGDVSVVNPYVNSKLDCINYKKAELTSSVDVVNNSDKNVTGILEGKIESVKFSKEVSLKAGERKTISFLPSEYKQLVISNPRVWWTHDLGRQELYNIEYSFKINNNISSNVKSHFGIREIKDYYNENGYRGFMLNGKKILIRGGGWVDNMLLDNTYTDLKTQIDYAVQMNLNTIRLEGFWGNNEDLYNLCDERGILLMAGWNCQWEQKVYIDRVETDYGVITNDADKYLLTEAWKDQIVWLRNHPSIFVWLYGSDKVTEPVLEKAYLKIIADYDPSRPSLSTAGNQVSTITGKAGVKMKGPYDYVPPHYWYTDTTNGGAYGFNTETGPGPQIPIISSIKKFIPPANLWPVDSMWNYHCGGLTFEDLNIYNEALDKRLGAPSSLEEYVTKAQFLNYEAMRAMYEAFTYNKHNATGIIQWMYNAAWPKFWWQFYDYYLVPNSSFYAARKAQEPVHIIYNYGNKKVAAVNNSFISYNGISAKTEIYDFNLKKIYSDVKQFNLDADASYDITSLDKLNNTSSVYFAVLKLYDKNGKEISSNFYTLSSTEDVLDYSRNQWFVTPLKGFADFTALNKLPQTSVETKVVKSNGKVNVEIKNNSSAIAYQLEVLLTGKDGEVIIPVTWDDNYISLLPGEKKIISCSADKKAAAVKLSGWNIKPSEIKLK